MSNIIPQEIIHRRIFVIRGEKVMIDRHLAELYGVDTRSLNQAVKRNRERFPESFMFQLNAAERDEVITFCDNFAEDESVIGRETRRELDYFQYDLIQTLQL